MRWSENVLMRRILWSVFLMMYVVSASVLPAGYAQTQVIEVFYRSAFKVVPNIHFAVNGNWTNLPGEKMQASDMNGWYHYSIELPSEDARIELAFNEDGQNWDSKNGSNYILEAPYRDVSIENGTIRKGKPKMTTVAVATKEPSVNDMFEETAPPIVRPSAPIVNKPTMKPVIKPSIKPVQTPKIKQPTKPTLNSPSKTLVKPSTKPVLVKTTTKATFKPSTKPVAKPSVKPAVKVTAKPVSKPLNKTTPKAIIRIPNNSFKDTYFARNDQTAKPVDVMDVIEELSTPEPTEKPMPERTEKPTPKLTEKPTPKPTPKVVKPQATVARLAKAGEKLGGDFREESIYFVMTARFYDGDSGNNDGGPLHNQSGNAKYNDPMWRGDFKGLIQKLDYIKALGFTAIWLTPVLQNKSSYDFHGYHIYDFNKIDPRLESPGASYGDLVRIAHEKGLKIVQDVVFNHSGPYGAVGLYTPDTPGMASLAQSEYYRPTTKFGIGSWESEQEQIHSLAGDCPDLNTENATVQKYLIDAHNKFIDLGVDAFRVDTVKHISRNTFNRTFLPAFQERGGKDFFMFGEAGSFVHDIWNRGIAPLSAPFYTWKERGKFSDNDELAAREAWQYEMGKGVGDGKQPSSDNAFLKGNTYHQPDYSNYSNLSVIDMLMHMHFSEAGSAFGKHDDDRFYNDATWNVVYVDSHDYGPNKSNGRYAGGKDGWAENMSLMWTYRGIPTLFYGSEIEFKPGDKFPVDMGSSKPLEETGRAYYGAHLEGDVKATDFGEYTASGEVAKTLSSPLSQHLIQLNKIRQAVPALQKGQYSTGNIDGYMAFKRRYTDAKTDSFALVTISGNATFKDIPNGTYTDVVTGDQKTVTNGQLVASCNGKGNIRVYVLDTEKTDAPGKIQGNSPFLK